MKFPINIDGTHKKIFNFLCVIDKLLLSVFVQVIDKLLLHEKQATNMGLGY
jgi:hypothetical protein